ncbi:cupin domain-containing protein [uncultured Arcticibacterium sp.]|uniref:cupin domain-containing protein n=1 Tax=uncultured Arcticibacterium sp. TaxID=2173042 RepID=UPI0030FA9D4C
MFNAAYWIEKLDLISHPEGGFYKETYRSPGSSSFLMNGEEKTRNHSTSIYFLMEKGDFSAFHKIQSDELWHFYAGDTLEIYHIDPKGNMITTLLGPNPEKGETLQTVIPANLWFASRPKNTAKYALVGCTVSPGFDFQDFEMAKRADLSIEFPEHRKIIEELTRE